MIGFLQTMTYLFAAYLVFKGVEIFEIAVISNAEKKRMIGLAIAIAGVALFFEESMMASDIGDQLNSIPGMTR